MYKYKNKQRRLKGQLFNYQGINRYLWDLKNPKIDHTFLVVY